MVNHSVRKACSRFRSTTNRRARLLQRMRQSRRARDASLIQKSASEFRHRLLPRRAVATTHARACWPQAWPQLERSARFREASEPEKQIAAHAFEQMIVLQRGLACQSVHDRERAAGPSAMPTATARLSSMTGERTRPSARHRAPRCAANRCRRAWRPGHDRR